jgi:NAD(P) transhydrogenase subunit alpha
VRLAIPTESLPGETLVAATPKTTAQLVAFGYDVVVESGAGSAATFRDEAYLAAGAKIVAAEEVWAADVVIKVNEPSAAEIARLRPGATVVARMPLGDQPQLFAALNANRVTGLSLDAIPRISRAQSMDVLSTMSNIAGYRGVIEAAESYGGMFAGQVTAAGKTQPATVFVIGAGVAGLAAIGAAGSLGANVRAFDVRPEVAEQIQSMGATFVSASGGVQERSSDGYAKELTQDQAAQTAMVYAEESARADILVTTALVRGHAPITITAEMVANMKPGSVIVDLAAANGGNCPLTEAGKTVVKHGVTLIGETNLPALVAADASALYARNVLDFLKLVLTKEGTFNVPMDDDIVAACLMTQAGEVRRK